MVPLTGSSAIGGRAPVLARRLAHQASASSGVQGEPDADDVVEGAEQRDRGLPPPGREPDRPRGERRADVDLRRALGEELEHARGKDERDAHEGGDEETERQREDDEPHERETPLEEGALVFVGDGHAQRERSRGLHRHG